MSVKIVIPRLEAILREINRIRGYKRYQNAKHGLPRLHHTKVGWMKPDDFLDFLEKMVRDAITDWGNFTGPESEADTAKADWPHASTVRVAPA